MSAKESLCKIVFTTDRKSIIWHPRGKVQAIRQALERLKTLGVSEPSIKQYHDAEIEGVYFNGRHLFRFNRAGEMKSPRKEKSKAREGRRVGGLAKVISIRHNRLHHPKYITITEARGLRRRVG